MLSKKIEPKNYIFDLNNTFKLNLNLINTIFSSYKNIKEEEKKLIKKLKKIEILFDKKGNLIKEKKKINGKILMDNQIFEEKKRTKNENFLSYKAQYEEIKGNSIRKEVMLKKYQKKFFDVEKYMKKHFKKYGRNALINSNNINMYIMENENLKLTKINVESDIKILKTNIHMLIKDNVQLKIRENILLTQTDYVKKNNGFEEINKYDSLIKFYSSKIFFLQNSISKLKKINEKLKIKSNNNIYKNKNKENNEDNDITKSEIGIDDKNINISILPNIYPKIENYLTTNVSIISKRSNFEWDISCIEKNID